MTYFFTDPEGMTGFLELSRALGDAGRKLALLPPVERGVYGVDDKRSAPRAKVGADVLPWWPVRGAFLLIEREASSPDALLDVDGVVGVWSSTALDVGPELASALAGQHLTYCFLDEDPVATAHRLRPVLNRRRTQPLFAAPFYPVVHHQWDRHVP